MCHDGTLSPQHQCSTRTTNTSNSDADHKSLASIHQGNKAPCTVRSILLLPFVAFNAAMQPSAPDTPTTVPITAVGARLDNRYTPHQVITSDPANGITGRDC